MPLLLPDIEASVCVVATRPERGWEGGRLVGSFARATKKKIAIAIKTKPNTTSGNAALLPAAVASHTQTREATPRARMTYVHTITAGRASLMVRTVRATAESASDECADDPRGVGWALETRTTRDDDRLVEMGGIEPPSTAVVMCLLRA
ncbi:hypothetical protein ASF88_14125 [Leifsonia sp. Leaf336]|nr:hypothetical protein ASF88_14125 [Leifsonia sp. Leaf336]